MTKFFFPIYIFLSITAQAQIGRDDSFGCLPSKQAEQYIRDFQIRINSFGGPELCDNSKDTKKLLNDLWIIETGKFRVFSNRHPLNQGFISQDSYYSWAKSQTRSINRGNDIPFATAYNQMGHFTMQDGWSILSTLGRVGTLIHEARHTAGYSHTRCTQGPYQGTSVSGCDRDLKDGGSHAVEMEYYARVALLGENFHPVYKSMARLMAVGRSNFVFNTGSLVSTERLLIRSNSEQTQLAADEKTWIPRQTPNLPNSKMKRTSAGAALFDGRNALTYDLYSQTGESDIIDDFSYLKLFRQDRGQGKEPLVDFLEADIAGKRFVLLLNQQGQITNYNFAEGKLNPWSQFSAPGGFFSTETPHGKKGLFLVHDTAIYELNTLGTLNPRLISETWPKELKSVMSLKEQRYFLSTNGELVVQDMAQQKESTLSLDIKDAVLVPTYSEFDLE